MTFELRTFVCPNVLHDDMPTYCVITSGMPLPKATLAEPKYHTGVYHTLKPVVAIDWNADPLPMPTDGTSWTYTQAFLEHMHAVTYLLNKDLDPTPMKGH